MGDPIQQGLQSLAVHDAAARAAIILCAAAVVYLMGIGWLTIVERRRGALTVAAAARVVALGVLAYLASKALTLVVVDPRPYIVAHAHPLIPTAHDNGFPSDHTLFAAVLTASLWWIDRRLVWSFALGTVLVMVGRLGIGAHHTIDVLGAVAIAAAAAIVARALPLPRRWEAPLLPALRRAVRTIVRPIVRRDPSA